MDIELMKKLEDSRKILATLNSSIDELIDTKTYQYIQSIRNDFSDFFKGKGFQIKTESLSVTAIYGNLVARLTHGEPETNYFGCYSAFTLDFKKLNGNEYSLLLNWKKPGISVSVSSQKGTDLQKDIEAVQKAINEKQERIDNFSQEEWKLFVNNSDLMFSESYQTISEFLDLIIK